VKDLHPLNPAFISIDCKRKNEPMHYTDIWTLESAKANFLELIRLARSGKPQQVVIEGGEVILLVDAKRFEVRARHSLANLAGFVERSKAYRGSPLEIRRFKMKLSSTYKSPFKRA
jgi:hypothetical protein